MAIKAIVESLDSVGELKTLYKEAQIGDKQVFVLDVEGVGGYALEDVGGLKSALEKVKQDAQSRKDALEAFKGLDPKDVREKLAKFDELRDSSPDAEKLAEQKVKQLSVKWEEEKANLVGQSDKYKSVIDQTLRKQVAIQAIAAAGGNAELLLPHVLGATRTREVDGQFVVDVVNSDGAARIKDANNNMSIADLVDEMRNSQTFGVAFKGTDKSGSGTQQSSFSPSQKSWGEAKTLEDQVAVIAAKLNNQ